MILPSPCALSYRAPVANRTTFPNGTQVTKYASPAFVTSTESTMEVCVKYTDNSDQNVSVPASIDAFAWPSGYPSVRALPATDVKTSASPENISLSERQSTVIEYTVAAGRNSTGFVGLGLWPPVLNCRAIPVAIGYQPSQVNASDFPNYEAGPYSCPTAGWAQIVGYTGASLAYLRSEWRFNPTQNVTNILVSSSPTSTGGENITFTMVIHSFSKPVAIGRSMDGYVRLFTGNPGLTTLPVGDACSWYPNNTAAVNDMIILPFGKMPSGYLQVNAPVLQIGPYSSASYSFSILISGPIANYTAIDVNADAISVAFFPVSIAGKLQTISGSCDSFLE